MAAQERYTYTKTLKNGVFVYEETYERREPDLDDPNVVATTYRTVKRIDPVAEVASLTAQRADFVAQGQALQQRINAINALG